MATDTRPGIKRGRDELCVKCKREWDEEDEEDCLKALMVLEDPYGMDTGELQRATRRWGKILYEKFSSDLALCEYAKEASRRLEENYKKIFPGEPLPDDSVMIKAKYFLALQKLKEL